MRATRALALLAAMALAAGAAACGGGVDAEDQRALDAGRTVRVQVGVIPIADVAPLYLGVRKGFFREEDLAVEPRPAQGGAAILPAVLNGEFQFGFSNTISLMIANVQGIPVRLVSQGVQGGRDRETSFSAVMVKGDGPIRSPRDLEGKTIAVNALNNIGEVSIKAALDKRGVDVEGLEFVEVPFPEMNTALERERVDAVWVVEPFVGQGLADGNRALFDNFVEVAPNLTVAAYFASLKYIERNPGVVERFSRAMNRSLEYARDHPEEARATVPEYTKIPAPAAEKMTLPTWSADLNRPTIERTADLGVRYGVLGAQPNLDRLLP